MVCSNAMKKKKQKKQKKGLNMITEISWRGPSIFCTFLPTFVTKRLLLLAKQFLAVKVVTVSPNLLATLVHPTPQYLTF